MTPAKIRRFVEAGLLEAVRDSRGYRFTFQDLVLLRTASELEAAECPPRQVSRALRRLRRQLPDRPLSAVQVTAEGRRVVVREGESAWEPDSGQFILGLRGAADASEPAAHPEGEREAVTPLRASRPSRPSAATKAPREPTGADDWFELGCQAESRSAEEARRAYFRALELESNHAGAHVNLGRILHESGELDAAEAHYRAALSDAASGVTEVSHPATAAFNLGVVLEDLGKPESAIEAYLRAVAADPQLADAHYNLARLYESAGDRSAAIRHLRKYSHLTQTS